MPLSPHTSLGRYEILSRLGAGGMGEIYLAHDTQLNRKVALKVLPANLVNSRVDLHRFEREARAASALNHPNIITIHEIGVEGDAHFIAMEFIEGETLRRKLQTARLEIEETLNIATQIAAALDAAHRSGIIHRDIKPENVMLREDGLVKVLDFGLAKLAEKKTKEVDSEATTRAQLKTEAGMILGTVAYMSPEQARGKETDARTDIFSLGVVLYEMLAGRLPFTGATTNDVIASILRTEPQPPGNFNQDIPTEFNRIVAKTLEKDREERYQTAKDLLVDLKHLKKQGEVQTEIERTASANKQIDNETAAQILDARPASNVGYVASVIRNHKRGFIASLSVLILAAIGIGYWFYGNSPADTKQIESIAVMPFVNQSGNADVEYLSDGMTESLITSLSQLPHLSVKARDSAFRYKGKEVEPRKVGAELSVQAVLLGRIALRGNDLALYVELVDANTENTLWKADYNRPMANPVALRSEIARDVLSKLRVRLSGADEQKLAKNYTENNEAYRLYFKGRYHVYKLIPSEIQKGISYFQEAIEIDPSYALAYAGLSDAYRSLALGAEIRPTEFLLNAKAAAQKAIEIDDSLAEGHTALAIATFWYDWDWKSAENHYKRALELNPQSANAHLFYAHLFSNLGRHSEALAEVKRARELDPLSPFVNALEGQFLIHAGRTDEALASLQKTFGQEPNVWFTHLFASSAYIEKGMYTEAIAEARRARDLSGISTQPIAFLGYALAKSGKQAEARTEIKALLKLSTEGYVSPYSIALIYNGLDERDETFAWLERGIEQHDPKMTFLQVEPKWNNLRSGARFQNVLRRVGFTP